jgi:hypothetical protein
MSFLLNFWVNSNTADSTEYSPSCRYQTYLLTLKTARELCYVAFVVL